MRFDRWDTAFLGLCVGVVMAIAVVMVLGRPAPVESRAFRLDSIVQRVRAVSVWPLWICYHDRSLPREWSCLKLPEPTR